MTFPVGRANQSPWQALITLQAILLAEAQLLSDLTGARGLAFGWRRAGRSGVAA